MNSLYKIIILLVLITCTSVNAQQDPIYTMYRYNMNLINPAYAGADKATSLGVNVRSQWSSVKGAPETQSFIFGTALGKNLGLGASVISDRTFIEKQTSIALDVSYHLKLNETHDLYFGLKAGFNSYNANTEGLMSYGIQEDPSLMNLNGKLNPNFGTGVYLKHKDYFLSLSIPKILSTDRLEDENGIATTGADRKHVYLAGGYDFVLNSTTILKPSVLVRYLDASPVSIDLTTVLAFNDFFDLGASYRLNESVSGIAIFKVSNIMKIGYAYESPLENSIKNINNGTHEILFKLKI